MPSTSSDDDDIPEARVINEEPEEKEKSKFDPRADFMKGYAEGRPDTMTVPTLRSLEERIEALERTIEKLEYQITRMERRFE